MTPHRATKRPLGQTRHAYDLRMLISARLGERWKGSSLHEHEQFFNTQFF